MLDLVTSFIRALIIPAFFIFWQPQVALPYFGVGLIGVVALIQAVRLILFKKREKTGHMLLRRDSKLNLEAF